MTHTTVPNKCLWCVDARVVKDRCVKCDTKYGQRIEKKKKVKENILHMTDEEWQRVRHLKFKWEM